MQVEDEVVPQGVPLDARKLSQVKIMTSSQEEEVKEEEESIGEECDSLQAPECDSLQDEAGHEEDMQGPECNSSALCEESGGETPVSGQESPTSPEDPERSPMKKAEKKKLEGRMANQLKSKESDHGSAVRVAVHVRPLLFHEDNTKKKVSADEEQKTVALPMTLWGQGTKKFTFDHVYQAGEVDEENRDSCERLYTNCVLPLLDGCLDGLNATVLAYGQTGSGKTFTMGTTGGNRGVIPRLARDLFERVRKATEESQGNLEYSIKVSFFEVYREILSDLLIEKTHKSALSFREQRELQREKESGLSIREDSSRNVFVAGLTMVPVVCEEELIEQLELGCLNRATGSTEMNNTSSRSHAVFTVNVQAEDKDRGIVQTSKFHLVDLAGSERAKKTKAKGDRLAEGIDINLGLLALGNVISALGDDKLAKTGGHIPYRDSKLTRILQDSLGGNSRTCMIACISPAESNFEESLSTLRYANRAKKIKNKPVKNRSLNLEKVVKKLQEQVESLESQLEDTQRRLELEILKNQQYEEQMLSPVSENEQQPAATPVVEGGDRRKSSRASFSRRMSNQLERVRVSMATSTDFAEVEQVLELERQQHKVEMDLVRKDYDDQIARLEQELARRKGATLGGVGCFSGVKKIRFGKLRPKLFARRSAARREEEDDC